MAAFTNSSTPPLDGSLSPPPSGIGPLLDTFIPGFSLITTLASTYFHIDLTSYLTILLLLFGLAFALNYTWESLLYQFGEYFISTAEIRKDDEMYNYLMFWVSQQPFSQRTPRFVAGTKTSSNQVWDSDDEGSDDASDEDNNNTEEQLAMSGGYEDYLRLANREKIKRLHYTPSEGRHFFRYRGHWLAFTRVQEEKQPLWYAHSERIYISTLGRSTAVLKALLEEAQLAFLERDGNRTVIYRGQKKGGEEGSDWVRCMSRPPRPLSTVVLDEKQKQDFIADVSEYLHPQTRRWYSNRGIPYRRGYLFHGPPGTGKTSLCFAVAGLFGLKIYVVSLNSKTLTEDGLAILFSDLPRRCVVLLEDIDTAGVTSDRGPTASDTETPAATDTSDKDAKPKSEDSTTTQKGISLSALLNIIDGVASSEGRILVMTTNHIERLDGALLRPGRVDMSIGFGYADRETVGGLFRAVYLRLEGDWPAASSVAGAGAGAGEEGKSGPPSTATTAPGTGSLSVTFTAKGGDEKMKPQLSPPPFGFLQNPIHHHGRSDEEVRALATVFAERVPDGEFTPAEVQGYLLKHKSDPEVAVEGVVEWVGRLRGEREERERVKKGEKEGKAGEDGKTGEAIPPPTPPKSECGEAEKKEDVKNSPENAGGEEKVPCCAAVGRCGD